MPGYVDIHAHLLPGIDDGPEDLDGALEMARAAVDAGTDTIAATPHLRADFPRVHVRELAQHCDSLREALAAERIPLRVVSGSEVSLVWALDASDEELALASYGGHGRDLLVESPLTPVAGGVSRLLPELRARGFRITLAHPERSSDFQRDPGVLEQLANEGILLQLNADSLLPSERHAPTGRLSRELCRKGLAHVLASDGHRSSSWRPVTHLAPAVRAAAEVAGAERARWMAAGVPSAVANGELLPEAPPVTVARRRWSVRRMNWRQR